MKKIFSVFIIVIVAFSLTGCGKKISAEVKKTMTEFESLCDEYCDVVDKVISGSNSVTMSDLSSLTTKLNDVKAKVEKLKTRDLSDDEKTYILDVSERSMNKVQAALDSLKSLQ